MRNNEKLHIMKHVRCRESDRTGEESFMKYDLEHYGQYLTECEKSKNTIEKYLRDVRTFLIFSGERELSKEIVLDYKKLLVEKYRTSSVNSMLIAVNGYLNWIGRDDLRVRVCRTQRRIFREEERELTREEYQRLLMTARRENRERLFCILQTIAGTGMRIGELKYLTAETLEERKIRIDFKGKVRIILIPRSLRIILKDYCRKHKIKEGSIFRSRNGRPLDRRNIWTEMKSLCEKAKVAASKVFPHNLRHLFARCFYEKEHDLARLADYLGHSSIETTRRYTMITSEEACAKDLELGLVQREEAISEGEKGNMEQMGKRRIRLRHNVYYVITNPPLYSYIYITILTRKTFVFNGYSGFFTFLRFF